MDIQRELIYTDRPSLQKFDVDTKGSINQILYDDWLLSRIDLKPTEPGLKSRHLKVFNDAYFICTMAILHDVSVEYVAYSLERIDYPSVVMPMVLKT